jgi:hypothetical protein
MDDSKRPFSEALTPLDAAVEIAMLDCPLEWARYCELAQQLAERDNRTEISSENAARELLAADGNSVHQRSFEMGRITSFYSRLAGGPEIPLESFEIVLKETRRLEELFRDRLASALRSRRYSLTAFAGLKPVTVSPILIQPDQFRFGSDEMQLDDGAIKLKGVRIVPGQPNPQIDPPGRKPGQPSAKDRACNAALSILSNDAKRPPRGHGRKAELARMVCADLENAGSRYQENTVQRMIRDTVKDWEAKNPDK